MESQTNPKAPSAKKGSSRDLRKLNGSSADRSAAEKREELQYPTLAVPPAVADAPEIFLG
ncbi:MAG: hypothetical protein AB1640_03020 [bacterium]